MQPIDMIDVILPNLLIETSLHANFCSPYNGVIDITRIQRPDVLKRLVIFA